MFIYFGFSTLLAVAFKTSGVKGCKPYYLAWLVATLFSTLDEFYQSFIPRRSGDVKDVLIDHMDVVIRLVVVGVISRFAKNSMMTRGGR